MNNKSPKVVSLNMVLHDLSLPGDIQTAAHMQANPGAHCHAAAAIQPCVDCANGKLHVASLLILVCKRPVVGVAEQSRQVKRDQHSRWVFFTFWPS